MLQKLYDKMLDWAKHPLAVRYLAAVSFAESSFFPIPPDVMLAPMALAKPSRAFYFALIATLSSVVGGIIGYFIGAMIYEPVIVPLFHYMNMQSQLELMRGLFVNWGVVAILVAGFVTPIPYKIITISTGAFGINFYLFVVLSLIARGGRFFMVSGFMRFGGHKLESWLRENINRLCLASVLLLGVFCFFYV